jgi:8-oxo-dGTP pyrophosphatase MutT (NUDIX family)
MVKLSRPHSKFALLPIRLQHDVMARKGLVVDLHLILRQGVRILLGLRQNTGFSDGMYHLPAGHLEDGETISAGAIREAKEELGIDLHPADLHLVHVMHQRSGRLSLFSKSGSGRAIWSMPNPTSANRSTGFPATAYRRTSFLTRRSRCN